MWQLWSRLPFPSPEDLPEARTKPCIGRLSPAMTAQFFTTKPPGKSCMNDTAVNSLSDVFIVQHLFMLSLSKLWTDQYFLEIIIL